MIADPPNSDYLKLHFPDTHLKFESALKPLSFCSDTNPVQKAPGLLLNSYCKLLVMLTIMILIFLFIMVKFTLIFKSDVAGIN